VSRPVALLAGKHLAPEPARTDQKLNVTWEMTPSKRAQPVCAGSGIFASAPAPPRGNRDLSNYNTTDSSALHLDRRANAIAASIADRPDDEIINTDELARWLGVSTQWLAIGRCRGYGRPSSASPPPSCAIGYARSGAGSTSGRIGGRASSPAGKGMSPERVANMKAGRARRHAEASG
jgi:hypothetical protein